MRRPRTPPALLVALPLLALLALAAAPAAPAKPQAPAKPPEAAALPAGIQAVPAAEVEKLRKEYWKVEVVLRDGTTRVRGDLAGYSSVEGVVHVATDPATPHYHERILDEEVRSISFLGDARARPVEVDDIRKRLAAEVKAARAAGKLDALVREHEERLKGLDFGGRIGDRFRAGRAVKDELGWLTAAYCEREGKHDAEAVQRAQAKVLELPMAPGVRMLVQRILEGPKRFPDAGAPAPEEPPRPPPDGRR